jgi:hypothetical protein
MCQNSNTHNANKIHGSILITTNRIPVFMAAVAVKENNNSIITSRITFLGFQRFCRYAAQHGLFAENRNTLVCDFATAKALYLEFEEMEQNRSLTALLFKNNIYPVAPEVNALNGCGKVNPFNFWLKKARRWLQSAIGAGFFFSHAAKTN